MVIFLFWLLSKSKEITMDDKTEIESDQYFKEFRSSEKLPRPPRGRKRLDNPHDPFNNILTEIENTLLGVSALREGL
jgi:hypothetical protein